MHVSHDDVVHGNLGEVSLISVQMDYMARIKTCNLQSTLIPPSEEISRFEVSDDLSWVLIVEKEVCYTPPYIRSNVTLVQAVFQTLCHSGFSAHPTLPGPGIIITASLSHTLTKG